MNKPLNAPIAAVKIRFGQDLDASYFDALARHQRRKFGVDQRKQGLGGEWDTFGGQTTL